MSSWILTLSFFLLQGRGSERRVVEYLKAVIALALLGPSGLIETVMERSLVAAVEMSAIGT